MTEQKIQENMKIFDLYDTNEIKVEDEGLRKYICLEPKLVLKSHGRKTSKFDKLKMNIIERLILLIAVPGHRGKKHRIQTAWASGKYTKNLNVVLDAFKIIQKKTGKNPVEVLVKAIENSAPRDEVTTIEYGGARYPQAVDVSPMRRINLALRNLVHSSYDKSFNKKTKIHEALAKELMLAGEKSNESAAVKKKEDSEKQADSAR